MEKKTISKDIGEVTSIYSQLGNSNIHGVGIRVLIDYLLNVEAQGANCIEIYVEKDYDGYVDNVDVQPIHIRDETDEELNIREMAEIIVSNRRRLEKIKRDQEDYIRLKQIFEPNDNSPTT